MIDFENLYLSIVMFVCYLIDIYGMLKLSLIFANVPNVCCVHYTTKLNQF